MDKQTTSVSVVSRQRSVFAAPISALSASVRGCGQRAFAARVNLLAISVAAGNNSTTVTRKTKRPALPDLIATRPAAEPPKPGRNAYAVRVVPTVYLRTVADELAVTTCKQQSVVASAHTETAVINRKRKAP